MYSTLRQPLAAAALALALGGTASAAPITSTAFTNSTNNALGVAFGVTGLPASVSSTISITDTDLVSTLAVVVAVQHTLVGDLTYTLSHLGTTITLLDRTTTYGRGYIADLSKDRPLTFVDNATMPEQGVGNDAYPSYDRDPTDTNCSVGLESESVIATKAKTVGLSTGCLTTVFIPQDSILDAFGGARIAGDWTLKVSDREMTSDSGWFHSWTLRANDPQDGFVDPGTGTGNGDGDTGQNDVPEPATLALVGLALAGMGAARRRRH